MNYSIKSFVNETIKFGAMSFTTFSGITIHSVCEGLKVLFFIEENNDYIPVSRDYVEGVWNE